MLNSTTLLKLRGACGNAGSLFFTAQPLKSATVAALPRLAAIALALSAPGCTLFYTRPVQNMSDTSAAIKAAREVQADTLAPELFRQSNEWFFRAKREYRTKNFELAAEYAHKARFFAEQAEYEAMRNGAKRVEYTAPDPLSNQAVVSNSAPHADKPVTTIAAPLTPLNPFTTSAGGGMGGGMGSMGGGMGSMGGGMGSMGGGMGTMGGSMGTGMGGAMPGMPDPYAGMAGGMNTGMPGAPGAAPGTPGATGAPGSMNLPAQPGLPGVGISPSTPRF